MRHLGAVRLQCSKNAWLRVSGAGLRFSGAQALGCVLKARVFRGLAQLLEFRGSGSGLWEDRSYPALEL